MGSIAMVKVFCETLRRREGRKTDIDPWDLRDNFRLNHTPMRLLKLESDDGEELPFYVQYIDETTFNVYRTDENGYYVPVALEAKVQMS